MSGLVLPIETMSAAAADTLETMIELDELAAVGYTARWLLQTRPDLDRHSVTELDEGLGQLEHLGYVAALDDGEDEPAYAHTGTVLGRAAIARDRQRHHEFGLARQAALKAPRSRRSALAERSA